MQVSLATENDSNALINFFKEQPFLTGPPIDLVVNRKPPFFRKYQLQSDDYDTFILRDKQNQILGVASLVFRDAYMNGPNNRELTKIAYGTDLRISNNRKAIVTWPELFFPKFKEALDKRNCKYSISVMNYSQKEAYNALIRPRSQRRSIPRYYLFRNFDLISLHGRSLFISGNPLNSVKIFNADESDLEPLVNYLKKRTQNSPLTFPYSVEFMLNRLKRWPNLYIHDFLLAKDLRGNIVGCTAPWSMDPIQTYDVQKYSDIGESFRFYSQVISWIQLGHALPRKGQSFKVKFLTHLHADNPDIFRRMLKHAFRNIQKDEFLVYLNFKDDFIKYPPSAFVSSALPFAMYSVLPTGVPLPDFLKPKSFAPAPDFEPVLI